MSLKKLGLSPEGVSLATLTAAPDGSGIRFAATFGPAVVLDGPTLRYLANAEFAAEVDAFAGHATIPNEKLERLAAKHTVSRGLSHNLNPQ